MNIHHRPIFDTKRVCKIYSEKDGVPITYICTTALNEGTVPVDVFYRGTPHPEFGNRYFGLFESNSYGGVRGGVSITNADAVEDLSFEMIEVDGQWHYSQHRHDFYSVGGTTIDGGRAYIRLVGDIHVPRTTLKVWNGEFVMVPVFEEGMANETF
jgi:hypothetical protein